MPRKLTKATAFCIRRIGLLRLLYLPFSPIIFKSFRNPAFTVLAMLTIAAIVLCFMGIDLCRNSDNNIALETPIGFINNDEFSLLADRRDKNMKIKQMLLSRMDVFCYIIMDLETKTCALIDPAFDTERILDYTNKEGFEVTHVINTHGHSDHTAGNAAIIAKTGAALLIHEKDAKSLSRLTNSAFSRVLGGKGSPRPQVLLKDEDVIRVGETKLSVIHTPGHTPGSICIYLPGHVFTGDTLFVGAVGRTDLPGGSMKQLLSSIHKRIYTLPGDTIIWPGHDYGEDVSSTVDKEKRTNPFTGTGF